MWHVEGAREKEETFLVLLFMDIPDSNEFCFWETAFKSELPKDLVTRDAFIDAVVCFWSV